MSLLQISLLGRFTANVNGIALHGLESKKAQELFAYLLVNPRRPHHREVLARVLWPDHDSEQSRCYLRQALWQLNSALKPVSETTAIESIVQSSEGEWIGLQQPRSFWLDTAVLEGALEKARQCWCPTGLNGYFDEAERAVKIYNGGFLDGRHEQWIEIERHRLGDLYFELVQVLMSHCAATTRYGQGCEIGLASLRHDAARESTHRSMMRLQYLGGDRVAALRQYKCCESMLRREFGAVPDPETRALHDRILRAEPLHDAAEPPGAQNHPIEMVSELQRKIVKMERDIDELQTQLAVYARQPKRTA